MSWFSLLAIAFALALDAFAVATVAGLTIGVLTGRHLFRLSFHFGIFQAGMLAAGWAMGTAIHRLVASVDHWIAFILLLLVGGNVIREALREGKDRAPRDPTSGWQLVFLSIATSVDALAVGLSLAILGAPITMAAAVVGLTATALTLVGMALGRRIGALWGRRVEVFGGLILIAIGCKLLWDHLRM